MAITFNSNIAAQRASRVQNKVAQSLAQTFERLSSGMRINHAVDDAAGLAVSSLLGTQARVLNRGVRNVNDGISALQQVDATYSTTSSILVRMAELASQASNGSLSSSQRAALNTEYQQLDLEIRRLTKTTSFNGVQLADGQQSSRSAAQIASATVTSGAGVSADGKYFTFVNGTSIQQLDISTGTTTTLVAGLGGTISAKSDASGNLVAFTSTSNLAGQNSGGYQQVFTFNKRTNTFKQLTNISAAGTTFTVKALSADGSAVLYDNYSAFTDNFKVAQTDTGATTAIRSLVGGTYTNLTTTISSDGKWVAFLDDSIAFDGTFDLYRFHVGVSTSVEQISTFQADGQPGADDGIVAIDRSGNTFFSSSADLVGQNSGGHSQIFEATGAATFRQLGTNNLDFAPTLIQLTPDDSALLIIGNEDYGSNSSGATQLFRYEFSDSAMYQKTNYTSNIISGGYLAADGNSLVTASGGKVYSTDLSPAQSTLTVDAGGGGINGTISSLLSALNGNTIRGLGSYVLTNATAAAGALTAINDNIQRLSLARGNLGSSMSRLESAVRALGVRADEVRAAGSRITDADTAAEVANATRLSILQDSSTAILAQAKNVPQLALQILKDSGIGA